MGWWQRENFTGRTSVNDWAQSLFIPSFLVHVFLSVNGDGDDGCIQKSDRISQKIGMFLLRWSWCLINDNNFIFIRSHTTETCEIRSLTPYIWILQSLFASFLTLGELHHSLKS